MSKTTYLVGAGINRGVVGPNLRVPPLMRDFFSYLGSNAAFATEDAQEALRPLYEFIHRYWHIGVRQLGNTDLDLEECFTLLELQRRDALRSGDSATLSRTSRLEFLLSGVLLECLGKIGRWIFYSDAFRTLGRRIYSEGASVLTFNYDTLLEAAIEDASPAIRGATGQLWMRDPNRGINIQESEYYPREWRSCLAYKVRFDEVKVPGSGCEPPQAGSSFYRDLVSQEGLHAPFLKLHGSVGWYYHTGYALDGRLLQATTAETLERSLLSQGTPAFDFPELDHQNLEVLLPLIITPVLNKPYDRHVVFRDVWSKATTVLRGTKTLVVAGYSFPPTDFHVRRLLRECFADNCLESLCVINPDTAVVATAKSLTNFSKPVEVCASLDEYIGAAGV